MSLRRIAGATAVAVAGLASLGPFAAGASASPTPVNLGTAASFAVMSGSTATSAGVSTVTGNIGVSPGTSVTGFPPGVIRGNLDEGDAAAAAAHTDIATAYSDAVGRTAAAPIAGDLAGVTLTPGVYAAGAAITIAAGGILTLDAGGDPNGVFILQAGSTLGTGANSNVALAGGAQACNVFWQVGSSATLGASSTLTGTILASTSISMGDSVTVNGRALARDGAVTLINDTVTDTPCAGLRSNTAPPITPFSLKLTGFNQTVHTTLGAWSVTDATNSNAGYSITVSASAPTVNGSPSAAGTGGSLTLTPATATPATGESASAGPIATGPQQLSPTPSTIENAPVGTGEGEWDFASGSGGAGAGTIAIVIPGNAGAGSYSSTLTFTAAPPVAG
jgi:hypothetical protein